MAGRAGARAITSFPYSTKPSPDPARATKDSLRFPTVSRYLFSHPRTKTWCWPKTALFYPASSSPRGLNLFPSFRIRTGHSRESHPLRASLLFASPKMRRVLPTYARARQPSARSRSRSRAAPGVCAARVGKTATQSPAVSLGLRAERSSGLGSGLLPQGQATLGRQRRDKIKRRHHKAASAYRPRPQDPQAVAEPPRGGARRGAPIVPFRCIDG